MAVGPGDRRPGLGRPAGPERDPLEAVHFAERSPAAGNWHAGRPRPHRRPDRAMGNPADSGAARMTPDVRPSPSSQPASAGRTLPWRAALQDGAQEARVAEQLAYRVAERLLEALLGVRPGCQ